MAFTETFHSSGIKNRNAFRPPWKPLGVPHPDIFRITRPRLKRTGMNEQPFDDVVVPPQVGSSYGSGFVHVGEASFDSLAALAQQALSALASDPPAVLIYR
jgi:hypothetical protein